eukprot:46869-Amphidinium_carterae.1
MLEKVEQEAAKKHEHEFAVQRAALTNNISNLEANLRDSLTRSQEANLLVQSETLRRKALEQHAE